MTEGGDRLYLTTPVIHSSVMSQKANLDIYLKLENLQPPGSFKIRGISNMCQTAIRERQCSHIYCASSGNSGLATAYVCQKLKVPCTIVLPSSTPSFTADKLREMGAEVEIHGSVWDHANQFALQQSKKPGCAYVPPFDHPDIWEGNESIITESASQLSKKPGVVIACVGGGGLLNGVLQGLTRVGWQDVPVIAMETQGADCLNQSVKAGEIITLPDITSIAMSLGICVVSEKTFEYYKSGTYKILSQTVTDKDVVNACLRFADDQRFLVQPACGASLAAAYSSVIQKLQASGQLQPACGASLSAVYSGVIQKLQTSGRLPATISSALIIVCGGAVVTLDLLHQWKEQFDL